MGPKIAKEGDDGKCRRWPGCVFTSEACIRRANRGPLSHINSRGAAGQRRRGLHCGLSLKRSPQHETKRIFWSHNNLEFAHFRRRDK